MFQPHAWPQVILHVDGDAFFASVAQATSPQLKGRPVVTGAERGIATAISYEAKKLGITRAMRISEIKKQFPSCIIADSDYELYALFSQRMFEIIREFSPTVETYSIDEGFADLKGLRRPLHMTYEEIASAIQKKIKNSLGISVSVGISVTKSLAKLASGMRKPNGLVIIPGTRIESFLQHIPVQEVWGIGPQTSAYLKKQGIHTALEFAQKDESFISTYLSKPFFEIWKELRGIQVYFIQTQTKTTYRSLTRSRTFFPPTQNKDILWSRLMHHVEEAFQTARSLHYRVGHVWLFLKTQDFRFHSTDFALHKAVDIPSVIQKELELGFNAIWQKQSTYRTTGCTVSHFTSAGEMQQSLFQEEKERTTKFSKLSSLLEQKKVDFGYSLYDEEEKKKKRIPKKPSLPLLSLESFG